MSLSGRVAALVRARRRAADLRWRQPPPLAVSPRRVGPPRVWYLTPDLVSPAGGVRVAYRHVDVLNAAGIDAAVLHTKRGFRCTWFAHQTRTISAGEVVLTPDDVLVIPECYGPGLRRLPRVPRLVVFNQGAYHTFDLIPFAGTSPGAPYAGLPNLVALLTASEDGAAMLRYTFPDLPVHVARIALDRDVFHPPVAPAGRHIAYLTHRRPEERDQLLHMLRSRGVFAGTGMSGPSTGTGPGLGGTGMAAPGTGADLGGTGNGAPWELVPIEGRSESELAELLRSCAIFLSFSHREGLGLPPAEAMASGCYVVGFTGMGGREFFDPEYCAPVPDGDLLAFAEAVEQAMRAYDADPEALAKLGRIASERVLARYAPDRLREDLLAFYGPLVAP